MSAAMIHNLHGGMMPTEQDVTNEGRLARIEAKVDAFSLRFKEVFASQVRDHGKRIREHDALIQALRAELAELRGHRAGSKATLTLIISLISRASGVLGAVIGRLF